MSIDFGFGFEKSIVAEASASPKAAEEDMNNILKEVEKNAERVKQLGEWPSFKSIDSLTARVPVGPGAEASGFDAGIACALDLIPRDKQRLSAILHGNYTPEAVEQIQREIQIIDSPDARMILALTPDKIRKHFGSFADTETCWWLLGCYYCNEGGQDARAFHKQIEGFNVSASIPELRIQTAIDEWQTMRESFSMVDGVAVAKRDGGMQAAYVFGNPIAIQLMHGIWFVGTYYESLGVPDSFEWGTEKDEQGRPLSGPVFGSKQFVKCATFNELNVVLNFAKETIK